MYYNKKTADKIEWDQNRGSLGYRPERRVEMSGFLSFGTESHTMDMFSAPHLAAVALVLFFCCCLVSCRKLLEAENTAALFRRIFAVFILLQQIFIYIWYGVSGEWSVAVTLPLQLCDLSVFLSVAVLLTRHRLLTELLYYWGIGGAVQAILTPDIGPYTFPHFVYYQFFLSHGVILLACLYMVMVEKFKPSGKSVLRTFIITNLYALIIIPVNKLTGGNYLFLSRKPSGGSIMDLLGPWPWYILSLEAVALTIFILLYLPFSRPTARARSGEASGIERDQTQTPLNS